jgi:hypothetical protein
MLEEIVESKITKVFEEIMSGLGTMVARKVK